MHKYSVHQILYLITKQFEYDCFIRPGSVGPAVMEFVYLQWVHSVFHKRSNFCVQLRKLSNFRELLNLPGIIIWHFIFVQKHCCNRKSFHIARNKLWQNVSPLFFICNYDITQQRIMYTDIQHDYFQMYNTFLVHPFIQLFPYADNVYPCLRSLTFSHGIRPVQLFKNYCKYLKIVLILEHL